MKIWIALLFQVSITLCMQYCIHICSIVPKFCCKNRMHPTYQFQPELFRTSCQFWFQQELNIQFWCTPILDKFIWQRTSKTFKDPWASHKHSCVLPCSYSMVNNRLCKDQMTPTQAMPPQTTSPRAITWGQSPTKQLPTMTNALQTTFPFRKS